MFFDSQCILNLWWIRVVIWLTCDTCRRRMYKEAALEENNQKLEMKPVDTSVISEHPTDEVFDDINEDETYDQIADGETGYSSLDITNPQESPSDSYQPLTSVPELPTGEQTNDELPTGEQTKDESTSEPDDVLVLHDDSSTVV